MSKKELYILSAIIMVLLTYIVFRPNKSINYKIPKLATVEETSITEIRYKAMSIIKSGDQWILPSSYSASETVMERVLKNLSTLKVIDMISSRKDYKPYGLDELHPLIVKSRSGRELKIYIGNRSSTGGYTYVKLEERPEVYSIRGDLTTLIPQTEEELRNRTVFSYSRAEEMTITIGEKSYTLTGEELENNQFYISNLQAASFNDLTREDVIATISVKAEDDHTLIIYEKVGDEYPATSSDVSFPFTLPTYIVDRILAVEGEQ